jgi:hypothetical protein
MEGPTWVFLTAGTAATVREDALPATVAMHGKEPSHRSPPLLRTASSRACARAQGTVVRPLDGGTLTFR